MRAPTSGRPRRRLEAWLWTGPMGHLLGGALDVAEGLLAYRRRKRKAGGKPSAR